MNKASKKYYKSIKALIPCRGKYERTLLKNYKLQITELNEQNINIEFCDLESRFGTTESVINAYYEAVDTDKLIKKLQITKLIRFCIYIVLILTLIGFSFSVWLNIKTYHNVNSAIITHEKIIIK